MIVSIVPVKRWETSPSPCPRTDCNHGVRTFHDDRARVARDPVRPRARSMALRAARAAAARRADVTPTPGTNLAPRDFSSPSSSSPSPFPSSSFSPSLAPTPDAPSLRFASSRASATWTRRASFAVAARTAATAFATTRVALRTSLSAPRPRAASESCARPPERRCCRCSAPRAPSTRAALRARSSSERSTVSARAYGTASFESSA